LRGRAQREEDRTALNVALYQERVAELQAQQGEGVLDAAQMDTGRAEAARELLADTEGVEKPACRVWASRCRAGGDSGAGAGPGPVPAFGASDKVELTREFSQPPQSMEEMTRRLERAAAAQPDSAEGLYFLGRAYMAQNRSADAARIFERTVALAGRQPELLGQWAQAQYFADNKQWSPKVQALTDEALKLDPKEVTSLACLVSLPSRASVIRTPSIIGAVCWPNCHPKTTLVRRCKAVSIVPPRRLKTVAPWPRRR
jgi:cytochrome c-type biogenesis protein CcmH